MIEVVSKKNFDEILPLIREYQKFYKTEISDAKNREFFSQFGELNPAGCQFAYRHSGRVAGFATVYFCFASTLAAKVAILNDLYTVVDLRGKGIGRKLIEHCRDFAVRNAAERLQWATAIDNENAQYLYDSMNTVKSAWYFYTCSTQLER